MREFGGTIFGTAGDDDLVGSPEIDDFAVGQGGNDTIHAKGGNDFINFAGAYTHGDKVFGGGGDDVIQLVGTEEDSVVFGSNIDSIERIVLTGDADYAILMEDEAVAAGAVMAVDGSTLDASDNFILVATTETDGAFLVTGGDGGDLIGVGTGSDTIFGGDGDDQIVTGRGTDVVDGGIGDDFIGAGDGLSRDDRIAAGPGNDELYVNGDYTDGLVLKANTISSFEFMTFAGGFSYDFDLTKAVLGVAAMTIDASELEETDTLTLTAADQTVVFAIVAGAGADDLTGGEANDTLIGNGGADKMNGRGGTDAFIFSLVSDSTGKNYDTIAGFDALEDAISAGVITGVDEKVRHGALSTESFNADLKDAAGAGDLAASHAVVFAPDEGTLAGKLFLVVDQNGTAGYQANADLVVLLKSAKHMNELSELNFDPDA